MDNLRTIGIFGGTFDPIHLRHLRTALEIFENLHLDEMRLIPCNHPPHRPPPACLPTERLAMVGLAIANTCFKIDDREMNREGPSYFVDTLMSLRREYPKASLCMVVRMDIFLELHSWHQWEKLIQLANIIVACPTAWEMPKEGAMIDFLKKHELSNDETLSHFLAGRIKCAPITTFDISGRKIRTLIKTGKSAQFLLSEKVYDYIQKEKLYGYNDNLGARNEGDFR